MPWREINLLRFVGQAGFLRKLVKHFRLGVRHGARATFSQLLEACGASVLRLRIKPVADELCVKV